MHDLSDQTGTASRALSRFGSLSITVTLWHRERKTWRQSLQIMGLS